MDDIRKMIAAERGALASVLADLPPRMWDSPTLCDAWRVREVVAHITMPFRYSGPRFMLELARSRGRFNVMSDRVARRDAQSLSPAQLTTALRDNVQHPWKPPGGGYLGALNHDVIHGLDITVPLGIDRRVPADTMSVVMANITTAKTLRYFGVDLTGISLQATDLDWTYGSGAPLLGSAQDLALVLSGRKLPASRLGGASARFIRLRPVPLAPVRAVLAATRAGGRYRSRRPLPGLADWVAENDLVQAAFQDGADGPVLGQAVQGGGLMDRRRPVPALLLEAGPERLQVVIRAEVDIPDHRRRRRVVGVEAGERAAAATGPVRVVTVLGARRIDVHQFALYAVGEVVVPVSLSGNGRGQQFHVKPP
jgi:uncharacterized protein (TIGR03083 family)